MYITGTGIIDRNKTTKKSAKPGVGGFSDLVSSAEAEDSSSAATASVNSASNFLFLQEVNEDDHRKKEAVANGFDALKYLDNIKMGLLSGSLSENTLMGLDALLQKFRKNFTDPRLSEILDEIELRSKVEMAKLKRN